MDEEFIKECEKLGIKFRVKTGSFKSSIKIIESDFYELNLYHDSYENNIILKYRVYNIDQTLTEILNNHFPYLFPRLDTDAMCSDGVITLSNINQIIIQSPNDLLKKLKQLREMREFLEAVFDFAKNYKRKMNPITGE